jgi:hypothetical protein
MTEDKPTLEILSAYRVLGPQFSSKHLIVNRSARYSNEIPKGANHEIRGRRFQITFCRRTCRC